jgi:hypothetical protein
MATKKKAPKKRVTMGEPGCAECEAFINRLAHVLHASGSATTAPATTLAALLAAARGIELVLANRPGPDGQSISDIGAAHTFATAIPNGVLLALTEDIVAPWKVRPADEPVAKPATRKRKARK